MAFWNRKDSVGVARVAPAIPVRTNKGLRAVSRQRNFQAASSIYASWTSTAITPDDLVHNSLRTLRARSRELMVSTDFAPQFVRLCRNHIIGNNGFRFCGKARDRNDKLDDVANKALERAWNTWQKGKTCDFQGKHNGVSFDQLIVTTVAIDGEAFVQELFHKNGEIGFRLYDPETVPTDYNVARGKNQNLIRFGIEYDRFDRPVAYYFRDQNGSIAISYGYSNNGARLTRIPADQINHIFIQDRIGLRRGFPWMAASMVRFRMIGKFEDAAMQNALAGATKFGIVSGEGSEDVVDEIQEDGSRILDTEGLTIYQTGDDISFEKFDSQFPSNEFASFVKTNVRALASGVGVNYNTLSGDLEGVNFSSLKHGTSEERENWKSLQLWFIQDWKSVQYHRWLHRQLLIGIPVTPSKNLRLQDHDKYAKHEFFGRRWIGPDPLKEASADAINMKSNTTSPQRVMMDRGFDPDEVIEEIAAFHAKMREKGIPVEVGANVINLIMEGEEDAETKD